MSNTKVEELFHGTLELTSETARREYLDKHCVGQTELRAEVEKLLLAYKKTGGFMEEVPSLPLKQLIEEELEATRAPTRSASSFSIDKLPCRFGDYELIEKIAQGGMGVVFKARQLSLNRTVAMKMILSGQFAGQEEVERFYVEAEAAGNLDHQGIVPVFDVGCIQDQHFFCMAFIDGQTLNAAIAQSSFGPREAASLICKVCHAIQAAHDAGIVHRDLKPGNILIDSQNEPRITDFGLAKRIENESQLTRTGIVLGTPSYMPPEQAAGLEIDASADIYSLGAILYAMLTGLPPFKGQSQLETIMMVIEDEPTSLRLVNRSVPKDLESICMKCLEKKPRERYRSADELRQDLQQFLAGEPIEAKKGLVRKIRKWTIREPAFAAHICATLSILCLAVVNYWIFGDRGDGREVNFQVLKFNWATLCGWAVVLFVLQKVQNRFKTKYFVPVAWSVCNPIFLTMVLAVNVPPRELLLSAYFILIAASCLFRRVELVLVSTVGSLLGFSFLVYWFFESMGENLSYLIVFGVNIAVIGTILAFLTLRIKRLSEQAKS